MVFSKGPLAGRKFQVIGRYTLDKRLGQKESDEGDVYEAKQNGIIKCAVKFPRLDRIPKDTVENEVYLLSVLRHTHVVKIIDYGQPVDVADVPTGSTTEGREPSGSTPNLDSEEASRSTKTTGSERSKEPKAEMVLEKFGAGRNELPRFCMAMEHVPGKSLSDVFDKLTLEKFLNVIEQVLEALEYLHQRGVLHADVKPENVLFEEEQNNAVLIDLGFSIVADPTLLVEQPKEIETWLKDKKDVYFSSTEKFTRENLRNRIRTKIARDFVRKEMFPDHDLYALSRLISEGMASGHLQTQLNENPQLLRGLNHIVRRLDEKYYVREAGSTPSLAARIARDDIRKVRGDYFSPDTVPELSMVNFDGGHIELSSLDVPISNRIRRIIEHPFFQRLLYIPQLEFSYHVYPDAKHSRFSHCLRTYQLTREALAALLADCDFRLLASVPDINAALLFALLHDLGHYPLSHMFEDMRDTPTGKEDKILGDEGLFRNLIAGGDTTPIGKRIRKRLGSDESVASIIQKGFGEFGKETYNSLMTIADTLYIGGEGPGEKQPRPIHRILAGLISSAIDLDKIAYLTHDSEMSGVRYGQVVDVHGYLAALALPRILRPEIVDKPSGSMETTAEMKDDTNGGQNASEENGRRTLSIVGLNEKGLAAAESIVLARYWMLSRVYWHHANRAITAAFKFVINELVVARNLAFSEFFDKTFRTNEGEALRILDIMYERYRRGNPGRINPISGLAQNKREIYKRLIVISKTKKSDEQTWQNLTKANESDVTDKATIALSKFLESEKFADLRENKNEFFEDSGKLKRGALLVDIPGKARDTLKLDNVRIIRDSDSSSTDKSLKEVSPMLGHVTDAFLNEVKKCRVFIHPQLYEELDRMNVIEAARSKVRSAISEIVK